MMDDWQYDTEPAGDPHALCCRRCEAARESVARLTRLLIALDADDPRPPYVVTPIRAALMTELEKAAR